MTLTVLTVLPDHPLPATTGLHLRMIANIEAVNRLGVEHHVGWFGTEQRPGTAEHPAIPGCAGVVHLADRREQHEFSVAERLGAKLRYGVAGVLGRAATTSPFSMRYDAADAAQRIRRCAEAVGAQWVVLPSQGMHWAAHLRGHRVVIDAADVLTDVTLDLWRQAAPGPEWFGLWLNHRACSAQERRFFGAVEEVWTTTDAEADRVRSIAPAATAIAVPNSIDESSIAPLPPSTGASVGLLGTYTYRPNLDAAYELVQDIKPALDRQQDDTTISVAGAGLAPAQTAELASSGAEVLGRIDDLASWWQRMTVVALPVRTRGGVPLKLIEALARGRAVVATPELVAGLDLVDGRDLLVRSDPADFAAAIAELLADEVLRRRLEVAGRMAFERSFSWSATSRAVAGLSGLANASFERRVS